MTYIDPLGNAPKWWQWVIGGLALVGGAILCIVPGGQGIGVSLLIAGASMTLSNTLSAAGVSGKTASLIMSGLDIIGGIALCFTPFAGIGANMIGSGVGGIAFGFLFEAAGASFEAGAIIGNILGGMAGGKIYDSIKFSKIARQGILIGKMEVFKDAAKARNLAFYGGMHGYDVIAKRFPSLAAKLGWANNYHFISNVMQRSGRIYNLGGAVTGCYAKELEMIANYFNVINL